MMKSLFHAFLRGLEGGGCPMQADTGLKELARRGMGLRLLQQYGSVAGHTVPDRRVAVLSTLTERMFDYRAYYACHAVYYHLARLGFAAVVIDEEDVAVGGVPAGIEAVFIVRQRSPSSRRGAARCSPRGTRWSSCRA
jgi:hypothetical protein